MPLLVCPFESQKLVITSDTYVARCDLLSFIVSLLIGNSSIPNTYLDVLQYLQEAAYFMADFYVALSPSEIDDDSEILEKSL